MCKHLGACASMCVPIREELAETGSLLSPYRYRGSILKLLKFSGLVISTFTIELSHWPMTVQLIEKGLGLG